MMWQTARSILKRDPAAHSLAQVILTYPGLHALFLAPHRPFLCAVSPLCTGRDCQSVVGHDDRDFN